MNKRDEKSPIFLSPPHMGGREFEYLKEAYESNYIAPVGKFLDRFEESLREFTKADYALALSSATAAIHLALRVSGVGKGDRVLASTFTFIGSVAPILYCGAEPVFIDCDSSWNMDPSLLAEALEKEKPSAVVLTHLYGQMADMREITKLCREHGVVLIEDAAESLGAEMDGRQSGTFGDFGVYSFNGNKIVTTSGGGMLVGRDEDMMAHARKLSTQAREDVLWYEHIEYGYNYRLSNLLAAIGVGQMEVLPMWIESKRELFRRYREAFADIEELEWMPEIEGSRGNRWLSTMILKKSDPMRVIEALAEERIESRPLWKPMHMQPLFSKNRIYGGSVSRELFSRGICLPSGSDLKEEEQKRVIDTIRSRLCSG